MRGRHVYYQDTEWTVVSVSGSQMWLESCEGAAPVIADYNDVHIPKFYLEQDSEGTITIKASVYRSQVPVASLYMNQFRAAGIYGAGVNELADHIIALLNKANN